MTTHPPSGRSALRRARAQEGNGTWLITVRCSGRQSLLPPRVRRSVVQALFWVQRNRDVLVHGFVVMSSHVHLVLTLPAEKLSSTMHSLKSFTANEINRTLGRSGALWDEGYQDETLPTLEAAVAAIHYVEQNPVTAKMVTQAEHYEWSSAWAQYSRIIDPLL